MDPAPPYHLHSQHGRRIQGWLNTLSASNREAWHVAFVRAATLPTSQTKWLAWVDQPATRAAFTGLRVDDAAWAAISDDQRTGVGGIYELEANLENRQLVAGLFLALAADPQAGFVEAAIRVVEACYVKIPGYGPTDPRLGAACAVALARSGGPGVLALLRFLAKTGSGQAGKDIDKALTKVLPAEWAILDLELVTYALHANPDELLGFLRNVHQNNLAAKSGSRGFLTEAVVQAGESPTSREVFQRLVWSLREVPVEYGTWQDIDGNPVALDERMGLWRPEGPATVRWLDRVAQRQPFAQVQVDGSVVQGKPTGGPAELLAAIYADVSDLAAREIYADHLQQVQDPRGEFIALQLAGGKPTKREKDLLQTYARQWLGPLDGWLTTTPLVYRNGFLVEAKRIAKRSGESPASAPEWRTLEILDTNASRPPAQETLTGLRELYGVRIASYDGKPWPQVQVVGIFQHGWEQRRLTPQALEKVRHCFPNAHTVDFCDAVLAVEDWHLLESWGLAGIRVWSAAITDWLAIARAPGGPRVEMVGRQRAADRRVIGFAWELSKDGIRIRPGLKSTDLTELVGIAERLPQDARSVTLVTAKKDDPARAALEARGIEVTIERPDAG